ncbi:5014_t:CDS:1, partial [Ambispora gerdemannii]
PKEKIILSKTASVRRNELALETITSLCGTKTTVVAITTTSDESTTVVIISMEELGKVVVINFVAEVARVVV